MRGKLLWGAVVVALLSAAPAGAVTYKLVASKSASGDFATAVASGTATRPKAVYLAVIATPRQSVTGSWTMVCSKGAGAGSKSGDFTTSSSAKRKLKMPTVNPDSCSVAATAQLATGGKLVVRIYKR